MSDGTTLRVLSYNVRGLRDDKDAVVRTIVDSGADVVCVQEAPKIFRWRARAAALARRSGLVVVGGGGTAAGNLVLCRLGVTVHDVRTFFYPLTRGQQLRGAVVAHCSLAGSAFVVAGTHLATYAPERATQTSRLLRETGYGTAAALLVPAVPAVLAGDLNEEPDGEVWRLLGARLVDAGAGDTTPTFSVASPRRRIDGIFADPRLGVADHRVLDTPDVRRGSDHFPLLATLTLPD